MNKEDLLSNLLIKDIAKWNFEKHEYEKYNPDPKWKLILYSTDMDLQINCADCGKEMTYGDGYTSKALHNHVGFGYPVCENCYEHEIELANKFKD